jgi:hypothetical protein
VSFDFVVLRRKRIKKCKLTQQDAFLKNCEWIENFGGKGRRKRLVGRRGRKWEDNINMDLREIGCGCLD